MTADVRFYLIFLKTDPFPSFQYSSCATLGGHLNNTTAEPLFLSSSMGSTLQLLYFGVFYSIQRSFANLPPAFAPSCGLSDPPKHYRLSKTSGDVPANQDAIGPEVRHTYETCLFV